MFVWAHPPNWKQSFDMVLRYQTQIIYSRSGKEQRIAKRFEPRISFEFQNLARRDKFPAIQREIYRNLKEQIAVPFWPDTQRLTATAASGVTTLQVSTSRPWMQAGALLLLIYDGKGEAVRIAGIAGTSVVLETATTRPWPVGTYVSEGFLGLLDPDVSQKGYTSEVSAIDVQFNVAPGTSQIHDTGAQGTVFDGQEVFEVPVNWANAVQVEVKDPRKTLDFGRGVWEVFHPQEFLTITKRVSMLEEGFDSIRSIENFFRRCRGRQKEFYLPNPQRDMKAVGDLTLGTTTFTVSGEEFADLLSTDTVHRAVAIQTKAGPLYNQIENAVASGGDTVVYVRNAWTATVPLSEIGKVSIMNATRFASDALTIEWKSNSVATIRGAFQSLEDHWGAS